MNGEPRKIEVFEPFGQAMEMTKTILFRPFDLTKWLVVGFAAFLAGFVSGNGGGGFNGFNFPGPDDTEIKTSFRSTASDFASQVQQWETVFVVVLVAIFLVVFAIVLVLWWVGSRGQFIFTDCLVRNRAAIGVPWTEFKREGNSYFVFFVLSVFVCLAVIAVLALPVAIPLIRGKETDGMFWTALVIVGLLFVLFVVAFAICTQFMVPIMYRQRCRALDALKKNIALLAAYPIPIILYTLFLVVLFLAIAIVSCVATCLTCCIAALPYIGTVILLPLHVFVASYRLLFLRQFGPDFDVWANLPLPQPVAPLAPPPGPIAPG